MSTKIPIYEETGLEHCWNGTDPQGNLGKYKNWECKEYDLPSWLEPLITFLWILLALDTFIALYWMNYMWVNRTCREAVFKFKDNRPPKNAPLPGESVVSCCCVAVNTTKKCPGCGSLITKIQGWLKTIYKKFKKCFGLPDSKKQYEDDLNYNFYTDIMDADLTDDDIRFGHKAFYWPREKPKYTFTAKKRLTFTLTVMYAPILALLIDFVCDIQYLNQISKFSNRNLLDKHIQIDKAALFIVAIWDIFSFFTIPITCALVYKLSFTNNLKANLMGEVLIINVSYLLEDGVELMMQYFYFDKYAGVRYDYFETDGIVNIFFSAMISFTLAVFNIFALSHLFVQDQLKESGFGSKKSKIFAILLFCIGLIPLTAMFCRVIASCYQIFTFNKYRTGCLHFQPDETNQQLLVRQAQLFDFDCYRAIDYPLIIGNMVGIGLHILIAILLLIEHLFGTPSEIAILKRQSIVEEYPDLQAMKPVAENRNEDDANDEVVELNKTTNSKSSRSSKSSKGPYYSVPPEPQSTDEELEISTEAKRTSTFKPNVKLDYEPSINESEITMTIQSQPITSNDQAGDDHASKNKKTKKNKTKSKENTAQAHQSELYNQVHRQPEPKNENATKIYKKSRHERPRSKYYDTKEVDPNDNTWI